MHPLKAREIAELVSRLAEHADSQVVTKFVAQVGAAAAKGGDNFSRRKLADMFRKVRGDCIDMCTARVRFCGRAECRVPYSLLQTTPSPGVVV